MKQPHKPFVFFGTPEVAARTLAALLAAGFTPTAIVTNPDAPQGRGLALKPSPVRVLADAHHLPVLTPALLDEETQGTISALGASYAVVVAYGKIFPEALIDAFPLGVLNVHYSLLPKYRGATPLESALLNGETETGVTIQKMVRELDAGDIIAQARRAIDPDDTARELRPRLVEAGAQLLVTTLPDFEQDLLTPVPQDPSQAIHARKFKKEDGCLDLAASAQENWNKYRAYADTIGTHFFTSQGKRVKITKASLQKGLFVIERVIPEGKREMPFTPQT